MLAIIIPVYQEETGLARHMHTLLDALEGIPCRLMLVDDGSRDGSWREICRLAREDDRVRGIRFSRNFGKETAICAGLDAIDAEQYLVMDSDLQHPPTAIRPMLETMARTGCDIVDGVKASRGKESLRQKLLAKIFYRTLEKATGLPLDNSADFKLLSRRTVDALRSMHEGDRFFRGMVSFVGFSHETVYFDTAQRDDGVSSRFSAKSLIRLAWNAILGNTSAPLYLGFGCAGVCTLAAAADAVWMLARGGTPLRWLLLALFLCTGLLCLCMGVLGAYLARVYREVQNRPRYIVQETTEAQG